jgi:hypothetical protein
VRRAALPVLTLLALAAAPAGAAAKSASASAIPLPAGRLTFKNDGVLRVVGRNMALTGQRWRVRGIVSPFVAGQAVQVRFTRGGRRIATLSSAVHPVRGSRDGVFSVTFKGSPVGRVKVTALHAATPQQGAMSAAATVDVISTSAGPGAGGLKVRFLQSRLNALGYLVPRGGRFDAATSRAVVAYKKVNRMSRNDVVNARMYFRLANGKGRFRSRFTWHGRHVEVSLSRQVLALIYPGGQVYKVITISSGKPSTPTVRGSFSVFSKTPGYNSLGMLDANYFAAGGFAIHGYHDVPTFAASHGCVRAPIPNAGFLFNWIQYGTRVDVYG